MYLKNIEMKGFKSFADKTDLNFKGGITAIVGPNGSGKSNISDAVRWVLGEQSVKQLRGGKMEDVIFSGTQYRKPLGQASVSLTLDNSCGTLKVPYNEVTVTRRLYRSGESEYLINNSNVRLKDIHEIFMDTGIGKEGYSMIGQGKIDAILSGKPEERRVLVEEAAGITKYKTRKEEGEKKLKNAQDNLNRVEDIISTLEDRVEPLRLEKEKAEKFIVLDKELKGFQVTVFLKDLEELEEKNQKYIEEKKEVSEAFEESRNSYEKTKESHDLMEEELNSKSGKMNEARSSYYELRGTLDEKTSDIKISEERIKTLKDRIKSQDIYLEEARNNKEDIRTRTIELNSSLSQMEKEREESSKILSEFKEKLSKEEKRIDEFNLRTDEVKEELSALGNSLQKEEILLQKDRGNLEYLKGQAENLTSVSSNYLTNLNFNEEGVEKVKKEEEDLIKKEEDLKERLGDKEKHKGNIRKKRETLGAELEDLRRRVKDSQNKSSILKNLEEIHEGYNKSVKDLMIHLKNSKNPLLNTAKILGETVSTEEIYSIAIEAALGGYINNIITDTDKDASDLIKILKSRNLGRCTFLPRNIIKGNKLNLPKVKGVEILGLASELVNTTDEDRNIIDSILGRTVIAKNMETALEYARQTSHKIKIVTLEGDIIASGGAMTGGSMKGQKSGVISRKAELESLIQSIEKDIEEGKEKNLIYTKLREEEEESESELITLREEKNTILLEKERLKERLDSFRREIQRIKDLMNNQEKDSQKAEESIEEIQASISSKEKIIEELREKQDNLNLSLKEIREQRSTSYENAEKLRNEISEQRINLGQKEEKLRGIEKSIEELKKRDRQTDERIKDLEDSSKETLGTIESEEKNIVKLENEKEDLNKRLKESEEAMDSLEIEENTLKIKVKEAANYLNTIRDEYNLKEKELYKVELNLSKYEEDKAEIIRKVNEDLNLTLAEAKDLTIPIESKNKAKKRISELKGDINSLGTVNLTAIEEYSKVSTEYEFLVSQREDTLKAKEELLSLIAEMTYKMKAMFSENFSVLARNFKETFRQLFSGGNAELLLSSGDELEGNIEIQVQPPGKKLQNINLLSGGEKVLSAIALTFGILKMKPSPFCILDEIEAALDDANVHRYATFLKDFALDTQFILITHRKGTMEAANIMYGVTMEEKGISKIVSVDLEDKRGANG